MSKFFLAFILILSNSRATEVDNFTQRYEVILDSLSPINEEINKRFQKAISQSNKFNHACDENALLTEIKKQFVFFGYSKFEVWMQLNEELPKKKILKKHIYHDATIISTGSAVNLPFAMAPLFNIGGNIIGADKFSHMFTEGWIYFERMKNDNLDLIEVLEEGLEKETGLWGGLTMGIISYGDLAANFMGLLFWQSILEKSNYLKSGPYVNCHKRKWVQTKQVDISLFLNDALDEGINCNKFTKPRLEDQFNHNIQKLEDRENKRFLCPIDIQRCQNLKNKFSDVVKYITNDSCN